jgi:acyl-CoA synthetase (NDP forming)
LPNYSVPERAVKALSALVKHRDFLKTKKTDDMMPETLGGGDEFSSYRA